jgi:hypothetical protein
MPQYETAADRVNQDQVQFVLELAGFTVEQTDTFSTNDMMLYRDGSPYAIAEYKFRKKRFDPVKIDCTKVDYLLTKAAEMGVKPVLLYSFETVTPVNFWVCRHGLEVSTMQRTRGNRGDPATLTYEIPANEWGMI